MAEPPASPLHGEEVAIIGRLASMTRTDAVDTITAAGGRYVRAVAATTTLLVVGQDGWPLDDDGHLSGAARQANRLRENGVDVAVLTESELLVRLGRASLDGLFSAGQLARMLGIAPRELRAWVRAGLIRPHKTLRGLDYFDFQQVAGARELHRLTRAGATPQRIRRSLEQLRPWLPAAARALAWLELLQEDGSLLVRLDDGRLAEPSGQLHFDFEAPRRTAPLPHLGQPRQRTADQWFEAGIRAETQHRYDEAADAYHQALLVGGPEAEIAFNFGNALYAQGRKAEAVQRYMQAVETDPAYARAWNNLGNALSDLERAEPALAAYQRALQIEPSYSDAHFNLACTLDELGQRDAAGRHWRAYLEHAPDGPQAAAARQRLAAHGESSGS